MLPWLRRRETCWSHSSSNSQRRSRNASPRAARSRLSMRPMQPRLGQSRTVEPSGRVLLWDRPLPRPSLP
jgi:hypothetical protein